MTSSTSPGRAIVAFVTVVALAIGLSPTGANAASSRSPVFPPSSTPYRQSYNEWTARWWQWAWSVPARVNPLLDETGKNCGQGQSGQVFYLAGVINVSGSATRDCKVPQGKALFFPILNNEFDNFVCVDPDTHFTVKQLRAQAKAQMDGATALSATIDGTAIDVGGFRFTSPRFNITLPSKNLANALGCNDVAGTYGPAVGDGYYLMVKPLSRGTHTVSFSGSLPAFNFTLNITYHLSVG
jgi:hypothetical protein